MTNDAISFMRLGDMAAVAAGYPLRGSVEALAPGNIHFLQLKNTSIETDIEWAEVAKVTLPSKKEPAWLTDNDLIFASRGTKTLAYPLTDTPPKTVCAPQFFVLSVKDTNKISTAFLAWQLNQKHAQDYFQRTATGSYIQNIRRDVLENAVVAIPPAHEQSLIVSFWRTAQRERALLNRLIENRNHQLEALANGLLQQAMEKNS